eukprot:gnl/MRDRNA2_/MRDRNA2_33077_c0_seq1.p1 gnl/MRDRNA2_/MRDRNA2_33077_c0~~gnl/MRDRNA2_/MRDRNA2_33077_c0_seq1.p1  ORF type:complete len:478 (-),score=54.17 gnl/MRDRNA2_/MRDRNA2_33077_c0_seq1:212-1465(-)
MAVLFSSRAIVNEHYADDLAGKETIDTFLNSGTLQKVQDEGYRAGKNMIGKSASHGTSVKLHDADDHAGKDRNMNISITLPKHHLPDPESLDLESLSTPSEPSASELAILRQDSSSSPGGSGSESGRGSGSSIDGQTMPQDSIDPLSTVPKFDPEGNLSTSNITHSTDELQVHDSSRPPSTVEPHRNDTLSTTEQIRREDPSSTHITDDRIELPHRRQPQRHVAQRRLAAGVKTDPRSCGKCCYAVADGDRCHERPKDDWFTGDAADHPCTYPGDPKPFAEKVCQEGCLGTAELSVRPTSLTIPEVYECVSRAQHMKIGYRPPKPVKKKKPPRRQQYGVPDVRCEACCFAFGTAPPGDKCKKRHANAQRRIAQELNLQTMQLDCNTLNCFMKCVASGVPSSYQGVKHKDLQMCNRAS